MKQKTSSVSKETIHQLDHKIKLIKGQMRKEFSKKNCEIIEKYDVAMVNASIQKPTRYLHMNRLLSLTHRLNKDWDRTTKEDIDRVIFEIMETYSNSGKDTEYTYDHKKVLKIFFRWLKFGNRSYTRGNYVIWKGSITSFFDQPLDVSLVLTGKDPSSKVVTFTKEYIYNLYPDQTQYIDRMLDDVSNFDTCGYKLESV
ncbi:MAG: hypothetical protein QXW91_02260 [Candidatus Nitrosotenuis sp.]